MWLKVWSLGRCVIHSWMLETCIRFIRYTLYKTRYTGWVRAHPLLCLLPYCFVSITTSFPRTSFNSKQRSYGLWARLFHWQLILLFHVRFTVHLMSLKHPSEQLSHRWLLIESTHTWLFFSLRFTNFFNRQLVVLNAVQHKVLGSSLCFRAVNDFRQSCLLNQTIRQYMGLCWVNRINLLPN